MKIYVFSVVLTESDVNELLSFVPQHPKISGLNCEIKNGVFWINGSYDTGFLSLRVEFSTGWSLRCSGTTLTAKLDEVWASKVKVPDMLVEKVIMDNIREAVRSLPWISVTGDEITVDISKYQYPISVSFSSIRLSAGEVRIDG